MQPLAHLYSSLILETLRRMKNISLSRILRLHDPVTKVNFPVVHNLIIQYIIMLQDVDDIDEQSPNEEILQNIKKQTIIQYLIEILAQVMVTNSDIYEEVT